VRGDARQRVRHLRGDGEGAQLRLESRRAGALRRRRARVVDARGGAGGVQRRRIGARFPDGARARRRIRAGGVAGRGDRHGDPAGHRTVRLSRPRRSVRQPRRRPARRYRGRVNAVDDDFLALPLHAAADAGLTVARAAGASHADVRIHRMRTWTSTLRDGALQAAVDDSDCGVAGRVRLDGTWGFASHPVPGPDGAADAAARAVAVARTLRALNRDPVQWADEPVHRDAVWVSPYEIDPF